MSVVLMLECDDATHEVVVFGNQVPSRDQLIHCLDKQWRVNSVGYRVDPHNIIRAVVNARQTDAEVRVGRLLSLRGVLPPTNGLMGFSFDDRHETIRFRLSVENAKALKDSIEFYLSELNPVSEVGGDSEL